MVVRAAVLGHPIAQSLSPRIYNRWLEECGIEGVYEAFDIPPAYFEKAVRRLAADGYRGVNVTVPHKGAALALADTATEIARAVGASNLLLFTEGGIVADNSDAYGFSRSVLRAGGSVAADRAVVLGAGGASGAILYALRACREVVLLNRTREKAEVLADRFGNVTVADWEERHALAAAAPELLVNTTSLGMDGQPALDLRFGEKLPAMVVDIIYKPRETELLRRAREGGAAALNGLPMLVHQAVPSFEAYTGRTPKDPEATLRQLSDEMR